MLKIIGVTFLIGLFAVSCAPIVQQSNGNHGLPPGQAKKMTGAKSARDYAPGHNK